MNLKICFKTCILIGNNITRGLRVDDLKALAESHVLARHFQDDLMRLSELRRTAPPGPERSFFFSWGAASKRHAARAREIERMEEKIAAAAGTINSRVSGLVKPDQMLDLQKPDHLLGNAGIIASKCVDMAWQRHRFDADRENGLSPATVKRFIDARTGCQRRITHRPPCSKEALVRTSR